MKIDEILALDDIGTKIEKLKLYRGKYIRTNVFDNLDDWNPDHHEIMLDRKKYPDSNVIVEKGKKVVSATTGQVTSTDDKTESVEANRISLPIEQDITNIHTAFIVGIEPMLKCDTDDDKEKNLLRALKFTFKKNFIKYVNKKEVRSWLSEQEVAEYWYMTDDTDNFWAKLWRGLKAKAGIVSARRPKCTIWSPFRGDDLYPFMENDEMTGFMRGYKIKNEDNSEQQCYMVITDKEVITWKQMSGGWSETSFKHNFGKMPIIYMWRRSPVARKIKTLRIRLEKLLSEYADCIDYHFFPYLLLFGEIEKFQGKNKNHIIQMMGQGANAQYLTWNQVPDTVKFEAETLIEQIYALTNTPRITFDNLKSMTPASGVAFKFLFMGAHMAVENHSEVVGEFLQRRINFLVTALGNINSDLFKPSQTIDVEVEIQPYMIDDLASKVNIASQAKDAHIWSNRHAMMFVGNIDHIDEEMKEIMDEMRSDNQMEIDKELAVKGTAQEKKVSA